MHVNLKKVWRERPDKEKQFLSVFNTISNAGLFS